MCLQEKGNNSPKILAVALCPAYNSGSVSKELQGGQGRISAQASFLELVVALYYAFLIRGCYVVEIKCAKQFR